MTKERVVLPQIVSPRHYKLEITPDLTALTFRGVEDIDCEVSGSTKEIQLHCKEITVREASFTNTATGSTSTLVEISYRLKETILCLKFEDDLMLGAGVLHIEYDGILNGDMAGFYKSSYTDADGKKQIMASTQFEALDARRALPCWDEVCIATPTAMIFCI
jgi:aminopeptidase N